MRDSSDILQRFFFRDSFSELLLQRFSRDDSPEIVKLSSKNCSGSVQDRDPIGFLEDSWG